MRRFIIKSSYFVVPVLLLSIVVFLFNPQDQGDLVRVGYILQTSHNQEFSNPIKSVPMRMTYFSRQGQSVVDTFTYFTIGDSYSDKSNLGYNNFLANDSVSVLNLNRYYDQNPVQSLINFINSNAFDTLHVKYVILESAERYITYRGLKADTSGVFTQKDIIKLRKSNLSKDGQDEKYDFFSERIFKVLYINLLYNFMDNPPGSLTYKVRTRDTLFSAKTNELLFINEDIDYLNYNNSVDSVEKLNSRLNLLSQKLGTWGIKLIVLVCPDKYDLYYSSIKDKSNYVEPMFFEYLDDLQKDYLYVDTKSYLDSLKRKQKDLYYYGDTHWAPSTARAIAAEINNTLLFKNNMP
ncbi:hypothetical protein ACE01N_04540 [Saccharicrinis sp. FJH2]|uniref:alginate O-acetyltransferase AlgX-related protein n=1 Tax=Saccharicrinis sp. FJH65 TaxID=3344659 RepID=UPI0035F2A7F1